MLAMIYNGTIEYWDDSAIKQVNPNLNLPHQKIFVVFRSDASGTQEIFTTYLNVAARSTGRPPSWVRLQTTQLRPLGGLPEVKVTRE
ncbi:substrate-binding domain-containing protein [Fervidicoccus fontis]|uniref:Substrate-binding domain-containing protein n=1 Tax=Fervidicoccus fontis TaxID=683846 RepID=A0A843AIE4_9CREN|nr:substrate-binding domain-containing protein [Fervidicoccus fontis]MBE9391240.1 substrate-binding domain-containing protein [Fervidicoccus fontis]